MEPQPLLTRRPIVCTRCMHGHQVEVITDRMNSPVEYHCGFCGNYAIVGVPAKWPFMEVVKGPKPEIKNIEISQNIKSDHDGGGTSPMQVGESLKPKKEEKSMAKPTCLREGCRELSAALYLCEDHFQDVYGITVAEYRENKLHRTEAAAHVAARLKGESIDSHHKDEQPAPRKESNPNPAPLRSEPKAPAPEPACTVVIDRELLDRLVARAKGLYRTPDQQASYYISRGLSRDGA